MEKLRAFLKRKDIVFSAKRYFIDAMGAMAQGLFCTLLVGTILNTIGQQFHIEFLNAVIVTIGKGDGAVHYTIGGLCSAMVGPGMAVAIARALNAPPLVLFSLIPVGFATNYMGDAGGPLAVLFVAIVAAELGKAVSKETKIDILVTPIVTVLVGVGFAALIAAPVGTAASAVGQAIMWATELQPFFMGIIVSVVIGVALTLPITYAAICAAMRLKGQGGGAAVGWPGRPGPGHQYAADGQYRPQSPDMDTAYAGCRHHRPCRHLPVPLGDEWRAGVLRHGYLRPGGADRRLHRLGQRCGQRRKGRRHRHGLAGPGADLLCAARRADVAHRHPPTEVGVDQGWRSEAGSVKHKKGGVSRLFC